MKSLAADKLSEKAHECQAVEAVMTLLQRHTHMQMQMRTPAGCGSADRHARSSRCIKKPRGPPRQMKPNVPTPLLSVT